MKKFLCIGKVKGSSCENDSKRTDTYEYQIYVPGRTIEEARGLVAEIIATRSDFFQKIMEEQFVYNSKIEMPLMIMAEDEVPEIMKGYLELHNCKFATKRMIAAMQSLD